MVDIRLAAYIQGMRKDVNTRVAVAATAVLIVIAVLVFAAINPSLLYGLPALLWAIAEIIKAINGTARDRRPPRRTPETPFDEHDAEPEDTTGEDVLPPDQS
jgi:hypothetical protein